MGEWYIKEIFKTVHKKNPISGHCWTEPGPTIWWAICSPKLGIISKHRTEENAEKELKKYQ
jgi:hypothetical protein